MESWSFPLVQARVCCKCGDTPSPSRVGSRTQRDLCIEVSFRGNVPLSAVPRRHTTLLQGPGEVHKNQPQLLNRRKYNKQSLHSRRCPQKPTQSSGCLISIQEVCSYQNLLFVSSSVDKRPKESGFRFAVSMSLLPFTYPLLACLPWEISN